MTLPTHYMQMGSELQRKVVCNGGEVYLPTDIYQACPIASYEVADYTETGAEIWLILVDGKVTNYTLTPIDE